MRKALHTLIEKSDQAGKGFNKYDLSFAEDLASQDTWTDKQEYALYSILQSYQGQLEEEGIELEDRDPEAKITYDKYNDRFEVYLNSDLPRFHDIKDTLKDLVDPEWEDDKSCWYVPREQKDGLKKLGKKYVVSYVKQKRISYTEPDGFDGELRTYQKQAIEHIIDNGNTLIADQMGLGKTVESLCAVEEFKGYPCVIVMPSFVKHKWKDEINKFLPDRTCYLFEGQEGNKLDDDHDFYLINYYILHHRVKELQTIDPNCIVVDEAHYIKNPQAKRTKALLSLARSASTTLKLALTGTPVVSNPEELTTVLQFLDKLELFGGKNQFLEDYCDSTYVIRIQCKGSDYKNLKKAVSKAGARWDDNKKAYVLEDTDKVNYLWKSMASAGVANFKSKITTYYDNEGAKNKDALHTDLERNVMVRRTKEDVWDQVPEKSRQRLSIPVDGYEEKVAEVDKEYDWKIAGLAELRQWVAEQKLSEVYEFVDNTNEKIVIFAHHQEIVEQVYQEFEDTAVKVYGDTSSDDKNERVNQFQNDEDTKVLVGNMKSAGIGVNLTAAYQILFVEFPYSPDVIEQCEDRAHARANDPHKVDVHYAYAPDTVDEKLLDILEDKREKVEKIIDGEISKQGFRENVREQLIQGVKDHE